MTQAPTFEALPAAAAVPAGATEPAGEGWEAVRYESPERATEVLGMVSWIDWPAALAASVVGVRHPDGTVTVAYDLDEHDLDLRGTGGLPPYA